MVNSGESRIAVTGASGQLGSELVKDESPTKTFTITFPDKSEKYIKNVYTYWIDTELRILYLKDGNGEIIAAFHKWWSFTIKEERLDEH